MPQPTDTFIQELGEIAVKTFCDKGWRMQDGYYQVALGQQAGH